MNKRDEERERKGCTVDSNADLIALMRTVLHYRAAEGFPRGIFASRKEAASSILTPQAGASSINQIRLDRRDLTFITSLCSTASCPTDPIMAARVNIDGKEYLVCSVHTSIRCHPH